MRGLRRIGEMRDFKAYHLALSKSNFQKNQLALVRFFVKVSRYDKVDFAFVLVCGWYVKHLASFRLVCIGENL